MASEVALARPVLAWLSASGWDLYQEVQVETGGSRADIVGVRGPHLCVVEVKASLCLDLLAQAYEWVRRGLTNFVYAAAPAPRLMRDRWTPGRRMANMILAEHGIGLVEVRSDRVEETVHPAMFRRRSSESLRRALREEHKTAAPAGSRLGGHWTPFRATCESLRRLVEDRPGITMREAVLEMKQHHYASTSSAVSSLTHWIENGKVPGLELREDGRSRRLFAVPLAKVSP
jgi:hypothetical protein